MGELDQTQTSITPPHNEDLAPPQALNTRTFQGRKHILTGGYSTKEPQKQVVELANIPLRVNFWVDYFMTHGVVINGTKTIFDNRDDAMSHAKETVAREITRELRKKGMLGDKEKDITAYDIQVWLDEDQERKAKKTGGKG